MNPHYSKAVRELTAWFERRMRGGPLHVVVLTEREFGVGIDSVTDPEHRKLLDMAIEYCREEKEYEIGYGQLNKAYFEAAERTGKVKIEGRPFSPGQWVKVESVGAWEDKRYVGRLGVVNGMNSWGDVEVLLSGDRVVSPWSPEFLREVQ